MASELPPIPYLSQELQHSIHVPRIMLIRQYEISDLVSIKINPFQLEKANAMLKKFRFPISAGNRQILVDIVTTDLLQHASLDYNKLLWV